jgi:hypothetical protein
MFASIDLAQVVIQAATVFLALSLAVVVPLSLFWNKLGQWLWGRAGGRIYRLITQEARAEGAADRREAEIEEAIILLGSLVYELAGNPLWKQENIAAVQKQVHILRVLVPELGPDLDKLSNAVVYRFFDVLTARNLLQPIIDAIGITAGEATKL